jgi:hypothetical protein
LLGGEQITLDAIGNRLRDAGREAQLERAGAALEPGRQRRTAYGPYAHPHPGALDGAHPGRESVFASSLPVMMRHTTSGAVRSRSRRAARALVGLAARHAQLEQAPLGEQGQLLRRLPQLVPGERAIDGEHDALREAGFAGGGAHRVRRLAGRQRLIARDQIDGREPSGERGGQLVGFETQAA